MTRKLVVAVTLLALVAACGGGDSTPQGDNLTDTQKTQSTLLLQSVISSLNMIPGGGGAMVVPKSFGLKTLYDCPASGSIDVSDVGTSLTFTNCTFSTDAGSLVINGTLSLSSESGTDTITFDLSVTSGTESFDITGTISQTGSTVTFNISGQFSGTTYSLVGEITLNADETITGTLTITVDSESATCTFSNFNPATATEAEYASACGF